MKWSVWLHCETFSRWWFTFFRLKFYAEMLLDMLLLPSRLLLNCDEYELYYLLFCEQSINPKVLWRIWVPNNNEILFRRQLSNLWKDKNVETQNEGFHLAIHFLHFMCCCFWGVKLEKMLHESNAWRIEDEAKGFRDVCVYLTNEAILKTLAAVWLSAVWATMCFHWGKQRIIVGANFYFPFFFFLATKAHSPHCVHPSAQKKGSWEANAEAAGSIEGLSCFFQSEYIKLLCTDFVEI